MWPFQVSAKWPYLRDGAHHLMMMSSVFSGHFPDERIALYILTCWDLGSGAKVCINQMMILNNHYHRVKIIAEYVTVVS